MAEIPVQALLDQYVAEIGRLSGELINQRMAFQAELEELKQTFQDKLNGVQAEKGESLRQVERKRSS